MEIIAFALGFGAACVMFTAALRRAKKKPSGTTAKAITIMGGGGPGPGELPK